MFNHKTPTNSHKHHSPCHTGVFSPGLLQSCGPVGSLWSSSSSQPHTLLSLCQAVMVVVVVMLMVVVVVVLVVVVAVMVSVVVFVVGVVVRVMVEVVGV